MNRLPWLDYTGQTTPELLACKDTHCLDSLLCAFEQGIQTKPDHTVEEELVLAVMALQREVNNGGYDQFFVNSSRRYAPVIVDSLRRIGCTATAALTERAVASRRRAILSKCDEAFYQLAEIEPALFAFIETHQDRIHLIKATLPAPPPLKVSSVHKLLPHLLLRKHTGSLEDLRIAASELALQNGIPATGSEIEGVAVLCAFNRALKSGDLAACGELAPRAFELMRQDTLQCVLHRDWIKQLIQSARIEEADRSTLVYLEYLASCDQSTRSTKNRIAFWAPVLREHPAALPQSAEFFAHHFTPPPNFASTGIHR